jgi:chromate transporter
MRSKRTDLTDLAFLFLKLGTIAFGGPAAHIAMMDDEIVRRRKWLSRMDFLDLLGSTNLIPGPNSTEMAIHIGFKRAGWPGLFVAGGCFILPAALMVTAVAWAYIRYGSLPEVTGILYGVKPVVIVIVLQALWKLGRTALKTRYLAAAGIAGIILAGLRVNELLILFGGGAAFGIAKWIAGLAKKGGSRFRLRAFAPPLPILLHISSASVGMAVPFGLGPLFLFFLKVGSVLFGSGYVLLAFLRADLVARWHWMTEAQLLDAVAVGQVTPGPVFTTATFIGYVLGGVPGAAVATVGIFLPAFFFVAVSGPLIPRIRRSEIAGACLDGINATSMALMAVVTFDLGRDALADFTTIGIGIVSAILLFRLRVNSAWLVLGGAMAGMLLRSRV